MNLLAALVLVISSFIFAIFYIFFGDNITNFLDNSFFKISQFGKYEVSNNELRGKFKQHVDNE